MDQRCALVLANGRHIRPKKCVNYVLTSLKASRSSLTPIMSAVSANILGPISSTKSSKSTFPPPTTATHTHTDAVSALVWVSELEWKDSVLLTDLLAQFNELHLCGHVPHGPHALSQVFVTDVAFLVPVKLHKRLAELWKKTPWCTCHVNTLPELWLVKHWWWIEGQRPHRRSPPVSALCPVEGDADKIQKLRTSRFPLRLLLNKYFVRVCLAM